MAGKVNVSIADVSPNIYAAAKQSNLGETQLTQLDQFARTVKLNKKTPIKKLNTNESSTFIYLRVVKVSS